MFMFDWFWGVLGYLGLYNKSAKLLFLGLDNAGKTTLLHMLKYGKLAVYSPTFHPNMEELSIGNVTFKAYDLGGHDQARKVWRDYYATVDGVVFLVDGANTERFEEAKQELMGLLSCEELSSVPFLVLGNKIDLPECASEDHIRQGLALHHTTGKAGAALEDIRPIELFMCSVVKRQGFKEGFNWLSTYL
eukprot:TRINITY_DN14780_c0_g1_i1.p1 TRINITY_DN14780_c0_g1~~TRINITY_DN14780_c0_g1_i1.p1  ORF type:complete len:206 (-),score=47.54 TRINITY_DN14780_c0_g1_i1:346-915(-)